MRANTIDHDLPWPRRSVLKGIAVTAVAAGLGATAIGQYPGRRSFGAGPLEETPSTVDFVLYAGTDGQFAGGDQASDADVADPFEDFGFPVRPVAAGTDTAGAMFDTTDPTVSADGETIRYFLQYGSRQTPYQLVHQGGGTYYSEGAAIDFDWTNAERIPIPLFTIGETYRAVVHDVVQLYEPGGAFDWSVTRTDFFGQASGNHFVSLLTVVWDEDGPENGDFRDRGVPGRPMSHADGPIQPVFPMEVTPTVTGLTIEETVASLVQSGVSAEDVV